jgi:hypothetical protein
MAYQYLDAMNRFLFFILFVVLFSEGHAETVNGYIITLNNDTIKTEIHIPKNIYGMFVPDETASKVKVQDSNGSVKVFNPKEIKGYGFSYKSKQYTFLAKQTKNGKIKFLEVLLIGPKVSWYQYASTFQRTTSYIYSFELSEGQYVFGNDIAKIDKIINELRRAFKDDPVALKVIEEKLELYDNERSSLDIKWYKSAVKQLCL